MNRFKNGCPACGCESYEFTQRAHLHYVGTFGKVDEECSHTTYHGRRVASVKCIDCGRRYNRDAARGEDG